jgi:hypothetical protein
MADYSGYFLQGLGQGFETGFQLSQQKREMKWKEDQQKKLEQKQKEIEDAAQNYTNLVKEYGEDNILTNEEISKLNTAFLATGYEAQALIKDTHTNIQAMKTKKVQEDFEMLDLFINWSKGQSPENIKAAFEEMKGMAQTEESKRVFQAYDNLIKRQKEEIGSIAPWEFYKESAADVQAQTAKSVAGQTPGLEGVEFTEPAAKEPEELGVPDYNTVLNYLSKFTNKKVFDQQKASIEKNYGYDLSGITFESLQKPETSEKPATIKPKTVEDILFGDMGIISADTKKNTIDLGDPLSETEKERIINNYKIKKPALTPEQITEIERYFKQIGVDPYAVELPEPEAKEEEKKGVQWYNPLTWFNLPEGTGSKGRDRYGFVVGEIKEVDGKKYEYVGDNKWKPIS